MLSVVVLLVAGGLGAISRAFIDALGSRHLTGANGANGATSRGDHPAIPWPTTAINVSGSLVAGMVAGAVGGHAQVGTLAGVLAIGYLGAFTTFSTAMLQTVELVLAGARIRAVVHALLPLVASVGAAGLGWALIG